MPEPLRNRKKLEGVEFELPNRRDRASHEEPRSLPSLSVRAASAAVFNRCVSITYLPTYLRWARIVTPSLSLAQPSSV